MGQSSQRHQRHYPHRGGIETREEYNKQKFSIALVGDSKVGKSCIFRRLVDGEFDFQHVPTLTPNISNKNFQYYTESFQFELKDLAGDERFLTLNKLFYKSCDGVIFVYDITRKETLKSIIDVLYENVRNVCNTNVQLFLVGNKIDLYDWNKKEHEEIEEMAKEFQKNANIEGMTLCCKAGKYSVDEMFKKIAEKIVKASYYRIRI